MAAEDKTPAALEQTPAALLRCRLHRRPAGLLHLQPGHLPHAGLVLDRPHGGDDGVLPHQSARAGGEKQASRLPGRGHRQPGPSAGCTPGTGGCSPLRWYAWPFPGAGRPSGGFTADTFLPCAWRSPLCWLSGTSWSSGGGSDRSKEQRFGVLKPKASHRWNRRRYIQVLIS